MVFSKKHIPWNKGVPMKLETRLKVSEAKKNPSAETREKLSRRAKARMGIEYKGKFETHCEICDAVYRSFPYLKGRTRFCSARCRCKWISKMHRAENHPNWVQDRTKLARRDERNDSMYHEWRKNVWKRDNFKCKIADSNCKGRIEAHHILSWRDYPELRYQVNNGITLCYAHHPRKMSEEIRLQSAFQTLISNSKAVI